MVTLGKILDSLVKKAFNIVSDIGKIAGLLLNMKKTKAIWLGRWAKKKTNALEIRSIPSLV